ncbi:unnamed protein product [Calypogeia fissa]
MDHDQTIKKEIAAWKAHGELVAAGPSKSLPVGLRTKPRSPKAPRQIEHEAMAIPPMDLVSSGEVEEVVGSVDVGPTPSRHSDVSLDPMGVIDRFTLKEDSAEDKQRAREGEDIEMIDLGTLESIAQEEGVGPIMTVACKLEYE